MLSEAEVRSIISNYKITKKKNEEAVKELYSMLNDKNSLIDNCRESVALYRKTADSCVGGNSNYSTDSIDTIELAEEKYRECVKDIKVAISIMLEKSLKNDRVWSSYLSLPYKYNLNP